MSTQPGTDANLEQLLRSAAAAARDGKRSAAYALFHALSHEHADDPRVWLGVAATTGNPAEQRAALEQAVALDPTNERASRALARLGEARPGVTPVLRETLTSAARDGSTDTTRDSTDTTPPRRAATVVPAPADLETPQRSPFPLLNLLAAVVILLLLLSVGVVIGRNLLGAPQTGAAPTATLVLAIGPGAGSLSTPSLGEGLPTPLPATPAAMITTGQAALTTPPTPGSSGAPGAATTGPAATTPGAQVTPSPALGTPGPALTTGAELTLGQIIDYDGWSVTLLRPDYAVSLDGAIGDLQPAGRFVLAVVAVNNNSPAPRIIPPELFTLADSTGRSYRPVPDASTAYLALYERGQRGDLALEDVIEPGSGMRSVPVLFDVPASASGLRLTIPGAAGAGWPVGGPPPQPVQP